MATAIRQELNPCMNTIDRVTHPQRGEYRAKRMILEIYDAMQQTIDAGQPYRSRLDPPSGSPCDAEGNFLPITETVRAGWRLGADRLPDDLSPGGNNS